MKAGWETKSFAEIAEIKGGKRLPKGYSLQSIPTAHPYITVSDFTDDGTVDTSRIRYISDEVFEEIKRYTISTKDLYLSIAGTIGKTGRIPRELDGANLTENACKLVFYPNISRDYVYYFTLSNEFIEQAGVHTRTAAQPKLALERLKTIKLAIPDSEAEQQRIVAILDEAFEAIAAARANAEQNRQNARALFESYLEAIFNHAWQTGSVVSLSELATDITDGDHMPPPKSETGVPFITIGNIQKDTQQIDFSNTFKVPRGYFDGLKANKKPQSGDVLYTVTGSFGIPVLVESSAEFCFQRHIGLVRPKAGISSNWLYYLLMSPQVFNQANDGATGTAQKTVSLKLLRSFRVPRVTAEQQLEAVVKLDALRVDTQRLESLYQRKIEALDELKQSLLQQAFSGQL